MAKIELKKRRKKKKPSYFQQGGTVLAEVGGAGAAGFAHGVTKAAVSKKAARNLRWAGIAAGIASEFFLNKKKNPLLAEAGKIALYGFGSLEGSEHGEAMVQRWREYKAEKEQAREAEEKAEAEAKLQQLAELVLQMQAQQQQQAQQLAESQAEVRALLKAELESAPPPSAAESLNGTGKGHEVEEAVTVTATA